MVAVTVNPWFKRGGCGGASARPPARHTDSAQSSRHVALDYLSALQQPLPTHC